MKDQIKRRKKAQKKLIVSKEKKEKRENREKKRNKSKI